MCHAAQLAGFRFSEPEEIPSLVVLQIANEEELFRVFRYLEMNGIKTVVFFESWSDCGMTAIATECIYDEEKRKLFEAFEMWSSNGSK